MNNQMITKAKKFHGYLDTDNLQPGRVVETKHSMITERELSYRFYIHQHPYVQPLVQRLIHKGTKGLQAADTEYVPGEISLPYGVDVELGGSASSSIPDASRIGLFDKVIATDAGGNPVELAKASEFTLTGNSAVKFAAGARATLVDHLEPTPFPRDEFSVPAAMIAIASVDTPIELINATQVSLPEGMTVTLPVGIKVMLAPGTQFEIPGGIGMTVLRRRMQPAKDLYADFFDATYQPNKKLVQWPYPVKDLDFTSSGAYSVYNWELFYHVPLTIAIHLSKNQRFAEAQRWFHYLFDPTDDSDGPTPERFWKVRPFQYTDVKKIEDILVNLATGTDATLRNETVRSIKAWQDAPFRPHVVARYRQQAYMYKTVMAYLDNLIAWGDSLFRQDTGEAIDEALMLYVLAANILGPRPLPVPKKGQVRPQNYANLRNDLAQFGTVMRDMEGGLPFDLMPFPSTDSGDNARLATLRSLGKALYFCVPRNDKLLGYWDTVTDRLFKIRNSLNLQGTFRQLALFEPPIDPAMLVRATAAGLDVGAIVNGLNQPLPLVRFQLLVQKAAEICQEVKSLGNNLLSAMEKEDNEALAILRAKHERVVMEMVEHVRYGQLQEAIKSREGLQATLALAVHRYTFYERQLGKKADEIEKAIPDLPELDKDQLERMKFNSKEPELQLTEILVDISQDLGNSGGRIANSHEVHEMKKLDEARNDREMAAWIHRVGAGLAFLPEIEANMQPFGAGFSISFGGSHLSNAERLVASFWEDSSDAETHKAGIASRIGAYARREQDWAFQSNLAAGEISQIFKQIRAAQIREAVAEQELRSHRKQMENATEIEQFLNEEGTQKNGKKSNKALYTWMKREVKGLYAQCFQFAFDIAKKAERALQHELGNPNLSYVQYGYLAGKEGLLAGERLYMDIKRMEMAYHELNQREYELTKHISLLQVDPVALLQLRTEGSCTVQLPESLFDMDGPGHYFRRIKTVALSIPCVTGPYASINCKLTLLKSSIRKTPAVDDAYERADAEDSRFSDHFGSLQSIVTSSAQSDSGLFETNLRDERYLPFENSGVVSEWRLELPAEVRQFDFDTISDVILHLRYTARDGGTQLRNGAVENLKTLINNAEAAGSARLFSVRHEFPTDWAKFTAAQAVNNEFTLKIMLRNVHFPYWTQGLTRKATLLEWLEQTKDKRGSSLSEPTKVDNLPQIDTEPIEIILVSKSNKMDDIWLVLRYEAA